MPESDAVPLPRDGEVFFDVRGAARSMRLSWYAESRVAVFSIWQGDRCTATFRLPMADLARMAETLEQGPQPWHAGHGGQGQPDTGYQPPPAPPGFAQLTGHGAAAVPPGGGPGNAAYPRTDSYLGHGGYREAAAGQGAGSHSMPSVPGGPGRYSEPAAATGSGWYSEPTAATGPGRYAEPTAEPTASAAPGVHSWPPAHHGPDPAAHHGRTDYSEAFEHSGRGRYPQAAGYPQSPAYPATAARTSRPAYSEPDPHAGYPQAAEHPMAGAHADRRMEPQARSAAAQASHRGYPEPGGYGAGYQSDSGDPGRRARNPGGAPGQPYPDATGGRAGADPYGPGGGSSTPAAGAAAASHPYSHWNADGPAVPGAPGGADGRDRRRDDYDDDVALAGHSQRAGTAGQAGPDRWMAAPAIAGAWPGADEPEPDTGSLPFPSAPARNGAPAGGGRAASSY